MEQQQQKRQRGEEHHEDYRALGDQQAHRHPAGQKRCGVDHQHHIAVPQALVQQAVMDMPAFGRENGPSIQNPPPNHREQGVEDRDAQRQRGKRDPHQCGLLGRADHAAGADHEAQEHTAAVPHEDLRRIEVVDEEAREAAQQGQHEHGHDQLALVEREDDDDRTDDGRDPRRQAVQPVHEIQCDRHADDPQHGDRPGCPSELPIEQRSEADGVDPCPRSTHRKGRTGQAQELQLGSEPANIIDEAHGEDEDRCGQQDDHLGLNLAESLADIIVQDQDRDHQRQHRRDDGNAADARDGVLVHLPHTRGVHQAPSLGQTGDDRRTGDGHQCRSEIYAGVCLHGLARIRSDSPLLARTDRARVHRS